MTLLDELHKAHKDRIARMGGGIAPSFTPNVVQLPLSAEQLAKRADDFMALRDTVTDLSSEVATLKKREQIHTALMGRLMTSETDEKPKFGEIIDAVCEYYRLSRTDVMSARRTGDLILPRHIICYFGRTLTGMSFPQMGRRLGGRDHTTALHGANKIHDLLKTDMSLKDDIDVLELKIGAKVMARRFGPNVRPLA